jgi:hypothetical protein
MKMFSSVIRSLPRGSLLVARRLKSTVVEPPRPPPPPITLVKQEPVALTTNPLDEGRSAIAAAHSASAEGIVKLTPGDFLRSELRGALPEMEHLRGGLGGLAPVHLNIDSRIIHGFRWVATELLLEHEDVRMEKVSSLQQYIDMQGEYATIPAVLACSRTNTIIDGHHRHRVLQEMGFSLCPVLYVDYGHHDVQVHASQDHPHYGLSKQEVVDAGVHRKPLPPKSTNHVVRAGNGSVHPIVALSPNAGIVAGSKNLTGGWSYKPSMLRSHGRDH